ncbi:ornithine cyclodeaminase family protein [Cryobacterium frigoriphilum]|uniref:Ornithine cyclodeaminase family protein n=1 Tax=Cryobacterium frigoriphilum TaxID=1259150 RepID=A0A4R8ZTZ7_9MICO|nr:ornithine cyclodeaminase family protein [Cryobacterium frigoriphilum]TFD45393.1 ornithine cyclodeaminase family protein [Cryobacterium frigoriphilum]
MSTSTLAPVALITSEQVHEGLSMAEAVLALATALRAGLDPHAAPARGNIPLNRGSFLLMPGEFGDYAGVKILTVAPDNPAQNLPRIQGNYLLFDSHTLSPLALIDGIALTLLRTPAVSALGVDLLAAADASTLLVFGTGPQALFHVRAVAAVRPLTRVTIVGRSPERAAELVATLQAEGFTAAAGSAVDVADAQIVICCTSASEPLFDGALVRDDAVVVAMGSHDPAARETDDVLAARSRVYVEDVDTALREAGDVVIGIEHGGIDPLDLVTLSDLARNGAAPRSGPALFKSVGMGWQDLIIASALHAHRDNN